MPASRGKIEHKISFAPGEIIIKKGSIPTGIYLILRGNVTLVYSSEQERVPLYQYGRHRNFGEFCLQDIPAYFDYQTRTPVICLCIKQTPELLSMLKPNWKRIRIQTLNMLRDFLVLKYRYKSHTKGTNFNPELTNQTFFKGLASESKEIESDDSFDDLPGLLNTGTISQMFTASRVGKNVQDVSQLAGNGDSFSRMLLLAGRRDQLQPGGRPDHNLPSEALDEGIDSNLFSRLKMEPRFPGTALANLEKNPAPKSKQHKTSGALQGYSQVADNGPSNIMFTEVPDPQQPESKKHIQFQDEIVPKKIPDSVLESEFPDIPREKQGDSSFELRVANLEELALGIDKTQTLTVSQLPEESFEIFRLEHFGMDSDGEATSPGDSILSEKVNSGFVEMLKQKQKQQSAIGKALFTLPDKKNSLPKLTAQLREGLEYSEDWKDHELSCPTSLFFLDGKNQETLLQRSHAVYMSLEVSNIYLQAKIPAVVRYQQKVFGEIDRK